MVRAKIWFRCAAVHDPVCPVLVQPAVIGWEAKERRVDLTIERPFSGEELIRRMKGWVTVDPKQALETLKKHGFVKLLDDRAAVVECDRLEDFQALEKEIAGRFGSQLSLEKL